MAFTVYLIDGAGSSTTLGTLEAGTRDVDTFQVNKQAKEFSIRIASTTEEEWLTVYEITVDVDIREEEAR